MTLDLNGKQDRDSESSLISTIFGADYEGPSGYFGAFYYLVFELADLGPQGMSWQNMLAFFGLTAVEPFLHVPCWENLKYHESCMQKCFNPQPKFLFPDFEQVQIVKVLQDIRYIVHSKKIWLCCDWVWLIFLWSITIHPPNPGAGLVSYLIFVLQTPEPDYRTD